MDTDRKHHTSNTYNLYSSKYQIPAKIYFAMNLTRKHCKGTGVPVRKVYKSEISHSNRANCAEFYGITIYSSRESNKNTHGTSKLKINASQCYATLATNLIKLTTGAMNGFTAVLVVELMKEGAEIYMSADNISWFSSRCFTLPVGALFFAVVAHNIGNRPTMLIASLTYTIACVMFYFATNVVTLLSVQALVGFVMPISNGVGNTYVAEITQPHLRTAFTACTSLSLIVSTFFIVFLSNFLHWRTLALVILVFPTTGFLALCTVPESPYWLASKGQLDKAKAALSWLRGWTSVENVAVEFEKLKETYRPSSLKSERTSSTIEDSPSSKNMFFLKTTIRDLSNRSCYLPLASMCCMFLIQEISGFHVLSTFFIVIFGEIGSPIEPHVAGSMYDAARILGALIFIFSVGYIGRKKLVNISLVVATTSYLALSTALLLKDYNIDSQVCSWVAAIGMITSTFATASGMDKLIPVLNVEIYPTNFRNIGAGIGLFVFYVASSISQKLFLHVMYSLTLTGVFLMFGIGYALLCILYHVMLPEIEGKTLEEIKDHYNGTRKIKDEI